jgi:hyperosmotically inducible protein
MNKVTPPIFNPRRMAQAGVAAFLLSLCACAATDTHRSTGESIDDSTLAVKAKTALIQDDATKARNVDVEVYKGEVQLNGFVDSAEEKAAAQRVVARIEGVKGVRNNLQVQPQSRTSGEVIDDATLTGKVKSALIGDPRTKAYQIEVTTQKGEVLLGGFVDSSAAKSAAGEVAASIDGVKSVNNGIKVKG